MDRNRAELARTRAVRLARETDHVMARRALLAAGVPRWLIRLELRVGRWSRAGRQAVVLHNAPLTRAARRQVAVLEAGPRAALDGVSALQAAGVTALTDETVDVIVPKGARRVRRAGVRVHESRRWREEDIIRVGVARTTPAVAGVHAALWAVTDRQAVLFLTLAVQSAGASPLEVHDAVTAVRRHPRRRLLTTVVTDLSDGVRSLGELDVGAAMRGRGLPEPERQAVRRRPSGTQFLDADFPAYDIALEVDGAQHDDPEHRLKDLLRDLGLASEGRTVVRIPLVAWRLDRGAVLDSLESLFAARGWRRAA